VAITALQLPRERAGCTRARFMRGARRKRAGPADEGGGRGEGAAGALDRRPLELSRVLLEAQHMSGSSVLVTALASSREALKARGAGGSAGRRPAITPERAALAPPKVLVLGEDGRMGRGIFPVVPAMMPAADRLPEHRRRVSIRSPLPSKRSLSIPCSGGERPRLGGAEEKWRSEAGQLE